MSKLIPVNGRQLQQSELNPATVTYTVTAVDIPATRTFGHKNALLREKIHLECVCTGPYNSEGTYAGTGSADIQATGSVHCEGKPLLREGAKVTIECTGTVTTPPPGSTTIPDKKASVTITLVDANQDNIFAGER